MKGYRNIKNILPKRKPYVNGLVLGDVEHRPPVVFEHAFEGRVELEQYGRVGAQHVDVLLKATGQQALYPEVRVQKSTRLILERKWLDGTS